MFKMTSFYHITSYFELIHLKSTINMQERTVQNDRIINERRRGV